MRDRFRFIDGLRGMAALWVVLFHAKAHLPSALASMPEPVAQLVFFSGENGVAIFFVLSGFVIAHSVRNAPTDFRFLGVFCLRRSIRLDPPYWVSMALALSLAMLSAAVQSEQFDLPTLPQIAAHVVYLQELLDIPEIEDVYWTLTYEIQFYVVFIIARILAAKWGEGVWIGCMVVALMWGSGLVDENLYPALFTDLWYGFFLGVLVYKATEGPRAHAAFSLLWLVVMAGAMVKGSAFPATCAVTAAIIYLARRWQRLDVWLAAPFFQFLGLISYSLYLTHNRVTGATFFVWKRLAGDGIASELAGIVFVVGVCVCFAAVFWWAFERIPAKLARSVQYGRHEGSLP